MENVLAFRAASDLPAPIYRATYLASRANFPIPLTDAERCLLLELIGRVDARDGQTEFWVRSENIAAAIGKSLRTIGSIMAQLVDKGIIEKEQRRGRWGSFSSLTCRLTARAADLLGLTKAAPPLPAFANRKKTADALSVKPDNVSQTKALPAFQKNSQQLPSDLQVLFELGISMPGIFKLMRMCTQSGRRLGTVVESNLEAIKQARNRYAYLVRLLTSSEQRCEPTAEDQQQQRQKAVSEKRRQLACRWFRTPKGRVLRFDKDASTCELWIARADGRPAYETTLVGSGLTELVLKFDELSKDWIEVQRE